VFNTNGKVKPPCDRPFFSKKIISCLFSLYIVDVINDLEYFQHIGASNIVTLFSIVECNKPSRLNTF
jgi:hypothetical protein